MAGSFRRRSRTRKQYYKIGISSKCKIVYIGHCINQDGLSETWYLPYLSAEPRFRSVIFLFWYIFLSVRFWEFDARVHQNNTIYKRNSSFSRLEIAEYKWPYFVISRDEYKNPAFWWSKNFTVTQGIIKKRLTSQATFAIHADIVYTWWVWVKLKVRYHRTHGNLGKRIRAGWMGRRSSQEEASKTINVKLRNALTPEKSMQGLYEVREKPFIRDETKPQTATVITCGFEVCCSILNFIVIGQFKTYLSELNKTVYGVWVSQWKWTMSDRKLTSPRTRSNFWKP